MRPDVLLKRLKRIKDPSIAGITALIAVSTLPARAAGSKLKQVKGTVLGCRKCIKQRIKGEKTKQKRCECGHLTPSHLHICVHNRLRKDCKKCSCPSGV